MVYVSPINKVKKWDSLLKQTKISGENPYRLFSNWLFDVIQYGFLIELVRSIFFGFAGWKAILNLLAFGVLWWLVFDFMKTTKETITN